jgi:hypothetical protein
VEYTKIIFLRNFFLRAFVIGVLFGLIFLVLTLAFWDTWTAWVMHLFKVDEKDLGRAILLFFTQLRLVLFFLSSPRPCFALVRKEDR